MRRKRKNRRLIMRHIKEILRLKTISGLSNRQIANACNISFDNGIEISWGSSGLRYSLSSCSKSSFLPALRYLTTSALQRSSKAAGAWLSSSTLKSMIAQSCQKPALYVLYTLVPLWAYLLGFPGRAGFYGNTVMTGRIGITFIDDNLISYA